MVRNVLTSGPVWLLVGVVAGLAIAWNVVRLSPPAPLWATATHGSENLTMATGFIEADAEAVVFLDHVTGELTAHVININTGKIFATFNHRTLNNDLGLPAGTKNPKYLMTTGVSNFKTRGTKSGSLVVYVAEESTGQFVAYGFVWPGGIMNQAAKLPVGKFVRLDVPHKTSSAPRRAAEGGK